MRSLLLYMPLKLLAGVGVRSLREEENVTAISRTPKVVLPFANAMYTVRERVLIKRKCTGVLFVFGMFSPT